MQLFWVACCVAFFSIIRKSNLLVRSLDSFDPKLYLCHKDASFFNDEVIFAVHRSKNIQYRQRMLLILLPRILDCPLCPMHTLILWLRLCDLPPGAPLFTYPTCLGWLPLTVNVFQDKLLSFLTRLNLYPSDYSGYSFQRGGASFALECGLPTEVVKAQGE